MSLQKFANWLVSEDAKKMFESIGRATIKLSEWGEKLLEGQIAFAERFQEEYEKLSNAIRNLKIQECTEEEKSNYIKCYEAWGKYGWTFGEHTELSFFSRVPSSLEDADSTMMNIVDTNSIIRMKDKMVAVGVQEADLEEAYSCFENHQYKACALIVFALIDHKLISLGFRHPPKENKEKGDLKSGLSAICEYKNQNKKIFMKSILYAHLSYLNLVKSIMVLFASTEDFTKEETIVNRNYITHGMSARTVTNIDCVKLFSLLYSMVTIFPFLEEVKNDYHRKTL